MNELVQQLIARTGISEEQAHTAINMILSHLKGRLPEGLASHVDSLMQAEGSGQAGSGIPDIGGLFGGKKSA